MSGVLPRSALHVSASRRAPICAWWAARSTLATTPLGPHVRSSMPISFSSPSSSTSREAGARGAGVTAVLGPTNTGKTHLAIERMLGHSSGIIGLPLRLLAREVYNKVVERVGAEAVALITGEEKIKPREPALLGLDRRGDAARSRRRLPRRSTRCSSAPISSAAMSSPTACSTGAGARRRWCSARRPCGRWSSGCCRARMC